MLRPNLSPMVLSPWSHHTSRRPERGFSLTELMLAMTLGLLVIAASGQLYVGSRNAQHIVDTKTSLTENARFAMNFLGRDLRMAGYFTCGDYRTKIAKAVDEGNYW
jgi:type IV pilus assembly protein PilW